MAAATRTSWKTLPSPTARQPLELDLVVSDAVAERMRGGVVPREMEDRWFVYFEDGWLNFHRSWTGAHIFALRLDGAPFGVRVIDGWVSRDSADYSSPGIDEDRKLVRSLVGSLFGD